MNWKYKQMIRELVRPQSQKLVIDISQEYIGKDVEVLLFLDSEVKKHKKNDKTKKLLKEFEKISKKRVKPKVKYYLKMEDEVNDDIF